MEGCLVFIKNVSSAEKVILHGLFDTRIILMLWMMPWVAYKCYWIMWGGDLYSHKNGKKNWKVRVRNFFSRQVIKKIGHLVTYVPGDIKRAQKWCAARGEYHECLMYLSNVVSLEKIKAVERISESHSGLHILVGNSADPSNNHVESFKKILPYRDKDIRIYVPLSYGDQEHAKKVMSLGYEWFGDRFYPLTSFMEYDDYFKFLKNIDIAIFNHERQQAMGNTITLLALGKTVYMRSDVSQWDLFSSKGIKILNIADFDSSTLDSTRLARNKEIVIENFSRKKLIEQYSKLLRK
nr:TDP-N-acetylfucosamine:lipid II N-acetylfucosaminyltransferase [Marinobacterium ramblicola]